MIGKVKNNKLKYAEEAYYHYTKIGDSKDKDAEKYKMYKKGAETFLEGYEIDYDNFDGSISELHDVLDDVYYEFWRSRKEDNEDDESAFYDQIYSDSASDEAEAVLYLWMTKNAGDSEDKARFADLASNKFESIAKQAKDYRQKAMCYLMAAQVLPEPSEEKDKLRYQKTKRLLMLESYKSEYKYLDSLENSENKYSELRDLASRISQLKDFGEDLKDEQNLYEEVVKTIEDMPGWTAFSWRLRESVDAINLGKALSHKLYRDVGFYKTIQDWWDEDFLGQLTEFFDTSEVGKILTGNPEDVLCWNVLKLKGSSYSSTSDGRMGSFIAGDRRKFTYDDDSIEYLYKITFMIDAALDSRTGKMNYTIKVYDASGNEFHLDIDNDGKADIWRETEDSYASSREQPIAWYSSKRYDEACIEFYNVDDFVSDFKRLLKDNDNKICTKLAEAKKIYVNQEDTDQGNTQQDDDNDDCANC
jgi:hypothetical protein